MYSATHQFRREDAIKIGSGATFRDYVRTVYGQGPEHDTKWVRTVQEFRALKGASTGWNEDQTELCLSLPVQHKFSIRFWEDSKIDAVPKMLEALRAAEIGCRELCQGQDPANACWETLKLVRDALAVAGEPVLPSAGEAQ